MRLFKKYICKYWYGMAAFVSSYAYCALPTVNDSNASSGDYIAMGGDKAQDTIALGVKGIGAFMLMGVAWLGVSTLMEVNDGKKKWSDVGKNGLAGVALLAIGVILLTQADAAFE